MMTKVFRARGVAPLGRVVELVVVAESAAEAQRMVEDAGVQFVVISDHPARLAPPSSSHTSPTETSGAGA
jgi:hypothetical protein